MFFACLAEFAQSQFLCTGLRSTYGCIVDMTAHAAFHSDVLCFTLFHRFFTDIKRASLLLSSDIIDYEGMKLNLSPRLGIIVMILVWGFLVFYYYAPLTSFVTTHVLQSFHSTAYQGKIYELELVDKTKFQAREAAFVSSSYTSEFGIGSDIATLDGRAAALRKYLRDQGSPLTPYAELIVKEADTYKLDWRLVPAISGIESRFCRITPVDTNNCWGWRGGPGGTWQKFEDYGVGIKVLTSRLALGYGTNLTPYDIEPAYCPPCAASGHNWARAVTQYMQGMSLYLDKSRVTQ